MSTLAAKLQALNISDPAPESFIKRLTDTSLIALWEVDNPDVASEFKLSKKTPKKSLINTTLLKAINEAAAKNIFERLSHVQLEAIAKDVPLEHKISYKNKDGTSKRVPMKVLEKRLNEFVTASSVETFFHKYFDENRALILELIDIFEIEYDEKASTSQLVDEFVSSAMLQGCHSFLMSIPMQVIQQVAINEKLTKGVVTSRDRVVEGLLKGKLPAPRVMNTEVEDMPSLKEIGKKRSISKSDYWGMWQHYNLSEIVEWCRKHNVKTTGTKKEVIERILAWREADKENKKKFESKETNRGAPKKKVLQETKSKSSSKKKEEKKSKEKKPVLASDSEEDEEVKNVKEVIKNEGASKSGKVVSKKEEVPEEKEVVSVASKVVATAKSGDSKRKQEDTESAKKAGSPPKKQKKEEVEEVAVEEESEEEVEEEEEEVVEIEEQDIDVVDDENAVGVIDGPDEFTLETLIKVCAHFGISVPETCKSKEDYVDLINNTVLDIENLDKYALSALKAYATEKNISVKGKNKEAIIAAIKELPEDEDEEEEEDDDAMKQ